MPLIINVDHLLGFVIDRAVADKAVYATHTEIGDMFF
jgi:hypothetical protein